MPDEPTIVAATEIALYTVDVPGEPIEIGTLVVASHVEAVNIIRDLRERWTNITGGHMHRYRTLLDSAMEEVRRSFIETLKRNGYDGAVGIRFATPNLTDGGAEVVMYGTGFRRKTQR